MLYVARTFTAAPRAGCIRRSARRAHETGEGGVELPRGPGPARRPGGRPARPWRAPPAAGVPAAIISSANSRSECRCTSESWNRPSTSCSPLRSATAALARVLVDHRREHLERVAQLLAPLPQLVQVLAAASRPRWRHRRGRPADRPARCCGRPARRQISGVRLGGVRESASAASSLPVGDQPLEPRDRSPRTSARRSAARRRRRWAANGSRSAASAATSQPAIVGQVRARRRPGPAPAWSGRRAT